MDFKNLVYDIVSQIPHGKVMTYGQIAGLAGSARSARIVGGIAHYGPTDLPWHRVVNRVGMLARGYTGGIELQKRLLLEEGFEINGYQIINFNQRLYVP